MRSQHSPDHNMVHASVCSGIGGFELAAQQMQWQNAFTCEINPFCRQILSYYWPNAKQYTNLTCTDFFIWRNRIDIFTGGVPCQPFSVAGNGEGTADPRHLWPYWFNAIQAIRPRWVVFENVRGFVSWNEGMVFDQVQTDLEIEGYEVQSFVLPAASVGAPHRRDRVWIIAHTSRHGYGRRRYRKDRSAKGQGKIELSSKKRFIADSAAFRRIQSQCRYEPSVHHQNSETNVWKDFPTQSPICSGNDGLSAQLDGITFSKFRRESIAAYGNAIVPQVALQIFNAIEAYTD